MQSRRYGTVSTYLHTNDKISKQILLRNPYMYALFSFNVLSTIFVSYLLSLLSSGFIAFEFGNNGWLYRNVGSSSRSSSANLSKNTLYIECSLEFRKNTFCFLSILYLILVSLSFHDLFLCVSCRNSRKRTLPRLYVL